MGEEAVGIEPYLGISVFLWFFLEEASVFTLSNHVQIYRFKAVFTDIHVKVGFIGFSKFCIRSNSL